MTQIPCETIAAHTWYQKLIFLQRTHKSRVSCQKGPTRHAKAWRVGPLWRNTQCTIEMPRNASYGSLRWLKLWPALILLLFCCMQYYAISDEDISKSYIFKVVVKSQASVEVGSYSRVHIKWCIGTLCLLGCQLSNKLYLPVRLDYFRGLCAFVLWAHTRLVACVKLLPIFTPMILLQQWHKHKDCHQVHVLAIRWRLIQ